MEAILSVVLTVYNVEKYIARALECLSKQSFKDFELIVVNDGSTDGSLKLIEEWKDKFKSIIVVNQKNNGVSAARNRGMSLSKGKYIIFLDSDDLYEEDMLENMLKIMQTHNCDITACEYNILEENQSNSLNNCIEEEIHEICYGEQLKEFLTHRKIDGYVWNKMFRLDFLKENNIRFIEGKIYEDTIMVFEVLLKKPRYFYTSKRLYNYIRRKGSITTLNNSSAVNNLYENAKIVFDSLSELSLVESLKEEYDYFRKLIYMQVLIQIKLNKMSNNRDNELALLESEIAHSLNYKNKYLSLRDKIYILILRNRLFKIYYRMFKSNKGAV